jgi:hypothetical protein
MWIDADSTNQPDGVYLGVNARPAKTKPNINGRSIPFRFLRQISKQSRELDATVNSSPSVRSSRAHLTNFRKPFRFS